MQAHNLTQQSYEAKELFAELHEEELDSIAGGFGLDDVVNGFKKVGGAVATAVKVYEASNEYGRVAFVGGATRAGQGLKDQAAHSSPRYDDFWYNLGYGGPSLIKK